MLIKTYILLGSETLYGVVNVSLGDISDPSYSHVSLSVCSFVRLSVRFYPNLFLSLSG